MLGIKDGTPLSEGILIGGSMAGDRASYARLYETHKDSLIAQATMTLCNGDADEAASLIQQAFTDVFANIQHIDRSVPFNDTMMDAARDIVTGGSRPERLSAMDEAMILADGLLRSQSSPTDDPLDILAERERVEESVAALRALFALSKAGDKKFSSGIRHVFEILQGRTIEDIAQSEKTTAAIVQSRIERARTSLQHILRPL